MTLNFSSRQVRIWKHLLVLSGEKIARRNRKLSEHYYKSTEEIKMTNNTPLSMSSGARARDVIDGPSPVSSRA